MPQTFESEPSAAFARMIKGGGMKIKRIFIVSVLAVASLGCGKREPRHIVILPDVSGSINRESLEQTFKAIDDLAGHLQRGDRLTIIPILSDAEAQASGRILRFEVPANRQAYDTDLRDFQTKLNSGLQEMQSKAATHPGAKTDILGTLRLAQQEFQSAEHTSDRRLIVISDFIQDYGRLNFNRDNHFDNENTAMHFAEQAAKEDQIHKFEHLKIYLGLLRSDEYAHMGQNRRNAIMTFWKTYLRSFSDGTEFRADGIGLLESLSPKEGLL
jgi:hypothetical protein